MRKKKAKTIRRLIIRDTVIIITLLTVILTAACTVVYYREIVSSSNSLRLDSINALARSIESRTDGVLFCGNMLATNEMLAEVLFSDVDPFSTSDEDIESHKVEIYNNRQYVRKVLFNMASLCPIQALGVYFNNGDIHYYHAITRTDLNELEEVRLAAERVIKGETNVAFAEPFTSQGRKLLGIAFPFSNSSTMEKYGAIAVIIDPGTLFGTIKELSVTGANGHKLFVVNETGKVLYSPYIDLKNISDIGLSMENLASESAMLPCSSGKWDQVLYAKLADTPWYICELEDSKDYLREIYYSTVVPPAVALVCGIISFTLIIATSKKIEKPVKQLVNEMGEVEKGTRKEVTENNEISEVHIISCQLNVMNEKLESARRREKEKEISQKEAELYSLQAQMNPHFIYNTLEIINMQLLVEGKYALSDMVADLGDIMRFNISNKDIIVSVDEEMEIARKYFQIVKMRYGSRLDYEIIISNEAKETLILKMLIQPLLENAVVHGIEKCDRPCRVTVSAAVENDMLHISIQDNAVGMDDETVKAINEGTFKKQYDKQSGVGIRNILKRINLYYGDKSHVHVTSVQGQGSLVELWLTKLTQAMER